MVDIGKLFETLTVNPRPEWSDEKRKAAWNKMMRHSVDVAERLYLAGAADDSRAVTLELDGGKCPRCGAELETITVDNPYALGERHRFVCRCFEREIEEDAGNNTRVFLRGPDLDRRIQVRCDKWGGGERCETTFRISREARPPMFDANGEPKYHRYYCEKHGMGASRPRKSRLGAEA